VKTVAGKKQGRGELSEAVLPRPLYFLVVLLSTLLAPLTNAAEITPQAALSI
jgi:hypothetical protein